MAAGFGLWQDGRCLAAGKWSDVARVRAYTRALPDREPICVAIELRDGSEVEVREDAPGWATFVNAAPEKLPGMPAAESWITELRAAPAGAADMALFERRALGA
ncbi:MAG: hypothetical protein JWM41_4909 [Gemmatimonadetes bacterium]|nr:hypothetical protein [Gemmatimonadota bacterium]